MFCCIFFCLVTSLNGKSTITYKDISVTTETEKYVVFASTTDYPKAIPVIINHESTRNSIDIVTRDGSDWIIFSNKAQKIIIRMYILP